MSEGWNMIVVDVHEPIELQEIADDVRDLGFDALVAGRERLYVIERKTIADLLHALYEGRLFDQLNRVRNESERMDGVGLLVVEGNHFVHYKGNVAKLLPAQWMGIQVAVAEHGVGLVRTWNLSETKLLLQVLDKRVEEEGHMFRMRRIAKKVSDLDNEILNVVAMIKGVGEKKAVKLMRKYGSIKSLCMASRNELESVLGRVVGGHVYEVLNKEVSLDEDM